jgi:hypothetical protein
MPVCEVDMSSEVEGSVCVPAVKVSVSLLSRCRYSGLAGRTSHELEGHGHALLIVRHVCGISRGVDWSGVGGGVAAGWSACWSSMRSRWLSQGRRRRRRKPGGTCRIRFALSGELRLQQARTGACYTIEPNPQTLSPHNSTHNVVHSCLQHAQAARHARIPRPAAREGPAPPGLSQDEDARSRKSSENCLPVLYTNIFAERGTLRLVPTATTKPYHPGRH